MTMSRRKTASCGVLILLLAALPAAGAAAPGPGGDEFFIISSIDVAHGKIVLKRPTDVTVPMRVDGRTVYRDEQGKPLRLADLRAGDTAWITSARDAAGELTARAVRLGPMTVEELQRRYPSAP
jgi:hypothetical protein